MSTPGAPVPDATPDAGPVGGWGRGARSTRAGRGSELRVAALAAAGLALAGVPVGLLWWWWSPARGIAIALGRTTLLPDETEAFVAADGRFAVLTGLVGLVAGLVGWRVLRAHRGPLLVAGLALGALAGSVVTDLVGRLVGGGVTGAPTQRYVTPTLQVRAHGLFVLEAAVALFVVVVALYGADGAGRPADAPAGTPDAAADAAPPA